MRKIVLFTGLLVKIAKLRNVVVITEKGKHASPHALFAPVIARSNDASRVCWDADNGHCLKGAQRIADYAE